jgi:excisionase family DNA binding protein
MVTSQVPNNLLTLKQVSELLNIHSNTLRRWCEEGRIPVLRITTRGDRRFRREDVQRYLDELNGSRNQTSVNTQVLPPWIG